MATEYTNDPSLEWDYDWETDFEQTFPYLYSKLSRRLINFISKVLKLQKREHCAEPKCPECNTAAFEAGKVAMAAEIRELIAEQRRSIERTAEGAAKEKVLRALETRFSLLPSDTK